MSGLYDVHVVQIIKRATVIRQRANNGNEAKEIALRTAKLAFADSKGRNKKWSEYSDDEPLVKACYRVDSMGLH